jgi:hypothetical protein
MNLQELQNLQEAYLDVYQELGEQKIDFYAGKLKSGHSPESALNTKYVNITNRLRKDTKSPKDKKKLKSRLNTLYNTRDKVEREYDKTQKESYDLYDIILSHLLDEGYADTQEAAESIMVNMSEEWRESICEGLGGAKNQGDYDEIERKRKEVRDEHLEKYKSGELPFQKQKKADQAQDFLKKYPKKKK